MEMPAYNLKIIIPELFLFAWATLVILLDLGTGRKQTRVLGWTAMAGLLVTGILLCATWGGITFNNMYTSDPLAVLFKVIFLGAAFMAIGSSFGILTDKIKNHRGEYIGLILYSTVGMMFLASSSELISLYIGLELTTIPLFILAAFFKDDRLSVEAGLKYFVVGAFSSAILLYGLSLLYGLTGTTDIVQMKINLSLLFLSYGKIGPGLILAMVMIIAGIGFKLALVPFHMWAPDVYQGSPTPITGFLSVGSKAAGIVAFSRIFVNGLIAFADSVMRPLDWGIIVAVMAAAAMVWGNLAAIRQDNIKRMLAFSSIAQVGYIMVGMLSASAMGIASIGYYMFLYLFANMGAFAAATFFGDRSGSDNISRYAGLSQSSPVFAACLSVFMLSLAGIPPLGGFAAKYLVFAAGIQAGYTWLVILGLLMAVVSLYYYANVVKVMYFAPGESIVDLKLSFTARLMLAIGVAGVIIFGVYPEPIIKLALDSAAAFAF